MMKEEAIDRFFRVAQQGVESAQYYVEQAKMNMFHGYRHAGKHFNCNLYISSAKKIFSSKPNESGWEFIEVYPLGRRFIPVVGGEVHTKTNWVSGENINIEFTCDDQVAMKKGCIDDPDAERCWVRRDDVTTYDYYESSYIRSLKDDDFYSEVIRRREAIVEWFDQCAQVRVGWQQDSVEFCEKFFPHRIEKYGGVKVGNMGDELVCELHIVLDVIQGIKGRTYCY